MTNQHVPTWGAWITRGGMVLIACCAFHFVQHSHTRLHAANLVEDSDTEAPNQKSAKSKKQSVSAAPDEKSDAPTSEAAPKSAPSPMPVAELPPREIFSRTVRGSAWVVVPGAQAGSYRTGSAWLIDKKKRVVVTNHHVIRGASKIEVIFPEFDEKKLITSPQHYLKESPRFTAKVFLDDAQRDLAFLKLNSLPADVEQLSLATDSISPGEMVYSVGNPGAVDESLWVFSSGSVRQVGRRTVNYRSGQRVNAEMIETQSPINPGDSGGPVMNDRAQVVGVVSGYTADARLVSHFIELSEIKTLQKELEELWEPRTAEQFYRRGVQAENRSDWSAAIADFNNALRLQPNFANAMAHRGLCFLAQKDVDTARADFSEAIKTDSNCIDARMGHLRIAMQNKEYDTMIDDATQIIRIAPNHAEAYANRARAKFFKQDYDASLKDVERAIEHAPTSAHYTMRAEVELKRKNVDAALSSFAKAVEVDPFNEIAVEEMTNTLLNAQRANDAIRMANDLIKRTNNNPYALVARARGMLNTNRPADAVQDLNAALGLQPRNDLYRLRGRAYSDLNEAELALSDYRTAVKLAPGLAIAHYDLGYTAFKFKQYTEAATELDRALQIDDKHAPTYITRAMVKFALNRNPDLIEQDVARAKELDSTYEKAKIEVRTTRHLVFYNDTNETVELSFWFESPAVDEKVYWYPGEPGLTNPIVWKLDPHTTNRLLFRQQSVDARRFLYTAKSLDSKVVWTANKDRPIEMVRDKEYISWRTEDFTYRLHINPTAEK